LSVRRRKNNIISPEIVLHELVISEFRRIKRNVAAILREDTVLHWNVSRQETAHEVAKAYRERDKVKSLSSDHCARLS
jgi:hypothetical protein